MSRIGVMAGLGLALSACACGPSADHGPKPGSTARVATERHVSKGQVQFARGTAEQAVSLSWIRPGTWSPVRMDVVGAMPVAALLSIDAAGARIVALSGNAGYDLFRIDLHCDKSNYSVSAARRSDRDDRPPTRDIKAVRSRVAPPEISRICGPTGKRGLKGSVYDAVAALRQNGPLPQTRMRPMPTPPSAAERAKAWEEYKARSGM